MKKATKILLSALCATAICGSAAAFAGCGGEQTANIRISGSTSVNEIMETLAGEYEKDNNVRIYINANGSGAGITDTKEGRNEIGMSSRALTEDETAGGLLGKQLCLDGIVLAVGKDCKVTQVTNEQVYNLTMNGTPIDADGATINAVAGREASSGTREAFDENIFDENGKSIKDWAKDKTSPKTYSNAVSNNTSTGAVIEKITNDSFNRTLGYISMGSYLKNTSTLTALKFQARGDSEFVAPSVETVKDGSYKMQRPFVIVTKKDAGLSEAAQAFYDWLWSETAQNIISEHGYVI